MLLMPTQSASQTRLTCSNCGKVFGSVDSVPVWPIHCSCGIVIHNKAHAPTTDVAGVVVVTHNARKRPLIDAESLPKYQEDRLLICRGCDRYLLDVSGRERCGYLVDNNISAGYLMGPHGIPNKNARCPDANNRRWLPNSDTDSA